MNEMAKRWTTGCQVALGCAVAGALVLQTGCNTFGKSKQPGLLSNRDGKVPSAYTEPPAPPTPPAPPAPLPAPVAVVLPAPAEPVAAEPMDKGPVETVAVAPATKGGFKQPPKVESKIGTYKVSQGDYLYKIAWLHHVSVDELAAFNKMKKTEVLKVGKVLQVPPGGHYDAKRPLPKPKVVVKKHEAPKAAAATADTAAVAVPGAALPATDSAAAAMVAPATTEAAPAAPATEAGQYAVQKNDNLWTIAKKFGVKSADIKSANKLKNNALQIGQVLVIPGGKAPAAAATAVAAGTASGPAPAAATAPATATAPDVAAPPSAGSAAVLPGGDGKATAPSVAGFPNTLEHTVLEGETLESVAEMYEAKIEDITKANPQVKSNADLKPNMTIVVPYK